MSINEVKFANITASSADLLGTYTGAAVGDSVWFEYALTKDGFTGSQVKSPEIPLTTPAGSIKVSMSNLSSGTTYYVEMSIRRKSDQHVLMGPVSSFVTLTNSTSK
jgi:hypothetical protein